MQLTSASRTRKPLRLPNHDYSQAGPYFVTICTHNKSCSLAMVRGERVELSSAGEVVREVWLPERFPRAVLDEFIIMPNHVHGILAFVGTGLVPPGATSTKSDRGKLCSLPTVIGAFKSISTIQINRLLGRNGLPFWQRNYYEHIIRDGDDMKNAQRYILENPLKWCSSAIVKALALLACFSAKPERAGQQPHSLDSPIPSLRRNAHIDL